MKPWRKQLWVIPPHANAAFVCAMEDILAIYTKDNNPRIPVICMDETCKQLTRETRISLPCRPGQPRRYDYEYERNGVANLFMFFEPFQGHRHVAVTDHRKKCDWAKQIQMLTDEWYPEADKIILILDNLNTHTGASLYEMFTPAEARRILERLEIHYTPKHGSWLNMAEIELSVLTRQCLRRRIPDKKSLAREIAAWEQRRNNAHTRVDWRFTMTNARMKLKRLYPILSE